MCDGRGNPFHKGQQVWSACAVVNRTEEQPVGVPANYHAALGRNGQAQAAAHYQRQGRQVVTLVEQIEG